MIDILNSLGIDSSIFIQMGISLVSIFLLGIVFKSFAGAHLRREKNTVGSETEAVEILAEAQELNKKFELHANEINAKIQAIYQGVKKKALVEQDEILRRAREKASSYLKENKLIIDQEMTKASQQKDQEATKLSQDIMVKIIGRDLTA